MAGWLSEREVSDDTGEEDGFMIIAKENSHYKKNCSKPFLKSLNKGMPKVLVYRRFVALLWRYLSSPVLDEGDALVMESWEL